MGLWAVLVLAGAAGGRAEETAPPEPTAPAPEAPAARKESAAAPSVNEPASPAWAADFGRDDYGWYAVIELGPAFQTLRWIVPGSPRPEGVARPERPYWLADTECTRRFFAAVLDRARVDGRIQYRPQMHTPAADYAAFIAALRERGIPARLPTEAEWEYARAAMHPNNTGYDSFAWHAGNSPADYLVAKRLPSADGLFDLAGNVWELVAGRDADGQFILRGGSYEENATTNPDALFWPARRLWDGQPNHAVGFRFAVEAE